MPLPPSTKIRGKYSGYYIYSMPYFTLISALLFFALSYQDYSLFWLYCNLHKQKSEFLFSLVNINKKKGKVPPRLYESICCLYICICSSNVFWYYSACLMVSYSASVFTVVTLLSFNTSDPILLKDSGSLFIFLVCYYNRTDNLSQNSCSKRTALITINLFYVLGVTPLSQINIDLLIAFCRPGQASEESWVFGPPKLILFCSLS